MHDPNEGNAADDRGGKLHAKDGTGLGVPAVLRYQECRCR
jgi:hypothetical protein